MSFIKNKNTLLSIAIIVAYGLWQLFESNMGPASSTTADNQVLAEAFTERRSDVQVKGRGTVVRLLSDDLKGSRHQRFILQVNDQQKILIAHNIDLAPKIETLELGDEVQFYGEYEWNEKGGVVHWTHHDPRGSHPGGWLVHKGTTYQ